MALGPYDAREFGAVTVFEDDYCEGNSARLFWNPDNQVGGATYYTYRDLDYAGLKSDTMNSLMVPQGYIVELFNQNSFTERYGAKQVVVGSYKDHSEEMVCVQVYQNDVISSLSIQRQPQGIANGYWQNVAQSGVSGPTYHVGLSYEDQTHMPYEEAERMSEALDLGLTFLSGSNAPLSLNPSQKQLVQRDVIANYANGG